MVEEIARHPASSASSIQEIDVLWINAGLSCDGDTIAMTAATQPSVEDLVLGNLPWIPKVNFFNAFLAFENGQEFMARFHRAANCDLADGRMLGHVWSRPGDASTDTYLRLDRAVSAQSMGRCGSRSLRGLRQNPCDGRQPARSRHGEVFSALSPFPPRLRVEIAVADQVIFAR
jgi:hypothetical protein